jgi:hypothetical protein
MIAPHALNPEDLRIESFETASPSNTYSLPTITDPTAETYCFVCPIDTYGG